MSQRPTEPALTRGDTWGIWVFMAAGALIAVVTIVQGALRVAELVTDSAFEVPADFRGTPAEAPIGPAGADVTVSLDHATLMVDSLPPAAIVAGVLEAVVVAATTVLAVALLILLSRELIRGHIFSPRNTRLAAAAGITWLIGIAAGPFFGNMVANSAFAEISDGTFTNVVMTVDVQTLGVAAFISAFVTSVFAVGDRLRRETEGLV